MSVDLQDLFDQAGRNPPAPTLDADAILHRARRSHHRRVTGVAVAVAVALAMGVGVVKQGHRGAASDPAKPSPTSLVLGSLGRLAFELDGDIYLADGDGRNRVRIADGSPVTEDDCANYWAEGLLWSPDGQYLVYNGDADAGDRTADGCGPRGTVNISDASGVRIASFPSEGWRVAWSPDSTRLATWVDFASTLGIYGLDGKRQALLPVTVGGVDSGDVDPVWSPDGTSLLLPGGVEIPVDGSPPRLLSSDDPRSQWQFTFSPDGTRVAYVTEAGLTVAAADGSQARLMVHAGSGKAGGWRFAPMWSPTGDRIAFISARRDESGGEGLINDFAVLEVATGAVAPLADIGGDAPVPGSMLEFSPEGDQILFTRTDGTGARSLWSVHTDGSDLHRLVAGADGGDWQAVFAKR
jgi:Tol biopolymer transport system component